jgi:2'-5' RNA ligase
MKEGRKKTIRTFIAVELPQEIQGKLGQFQSDFKESVPDVRWTKYGNIHLTLKFLGDVPLSKIDKIGEALRKVAARFPSFTMSLAGIGAFPNSRKPRVIWVGVKKGADELKDIARAIESFMKRLGFPPEKRRFSPHLTVGRIRHLKNPVAMAEALDKSEVGELGEFTVKRISLIKSQLDPAGSIYTTLTEASLKDVQ